MRKAELMAVGDDAAMATFVQLMHPGETTHSGDLALSAALDAVGNCTEAVRSSDFNPEVAAEVFGRLHESLGYEPDQKPRVTALSRSIRRPPHDYYSPPLTYRPAEKEHSAGVHVAGMTAMIANAPNAQLTLEDRAELIWGLITGCTEKRYVGNENHRTRPIGMGAAIDATRQELIAHKKAAMSGKTPKAIFAYEDLLREVNSKTHFYSRLAAGTASVLAVALLVARKM